MKREEESSTGDQRIWQESPLDWARDAGLSAEVLAAVREREGRRRRRVVAATAVLGILLLGGISSRFLSTRYPGGAEAGLSEAASSRSGVVAMAPTRKLDDGSTVQVRPGAEITVEFTARERRVFLTRGEAVFEVRKDAARPFVVVAAGVRLRAVGTAFSVGVKDDAVEMLVTEGTVAVERSADLTYSAAAAPREPAAHETFVPWAVVPAGNRIIVEVDLRLPPAVLPLTPEEASERLAWRVPRLTFNATPLEEVVRLLNAHAAERIEIEADRLRRLEISGALRADNLEPLLGILEANYGIEVQRDARGTIRLR